MPALFTAPDNKTVMLGMSVVKGASSSRGLPFPHILVGSDGIVRAVKYGTQVPGIIMWGDLSCHNGQLTMHNNNKTKTDHAVVKLLGFREITGINYHEEGPCPRRNQPTTKLDSIWCPDCGANQDYLNGGHPDDGIAIRWSPPKQWKLWSHDDVCAWLLELPPKTDLRLVRTNWWDDTYLLSWDGKELTLKPRFNWQKME